jgi:ubiquinone/menaquinone biosynthesis C-methylase UbiE
MGFHTYDPANADALEDTSRYEYVSIDELLALFDPHGTVADLGSGTGFYTDDVAPYAENVYAVDVQEEMHERYRQKGMPENVECVTSEVSDLPFDDASIDCAFSTMTYHEFASDAALTELARVVAPGGLVGIADWTRNGTGNEGPPTSERYTLDDALAAFDDADFEITDSDERRETLVLSARRL